MSILPSLFSFRMSVLPQAFFKNCILGVGSKLGPLGTSATNWPLVTVLGDCEDGELGGTKIDRENRSTPRKIWPDPGSNPCRRGG
jgi:hypothetical protein